MKVALDFFVVRFVHIARFLDPYFQKDFNRYENKKNKNYVQVFCMNIIILMSNFYKMLVFHTFDMVIRTVRHNMRVGGVVHKSDTIHKILSLHSVQRHRIYSIIPKKPHNISVCPQKKRESNQFISLLYILGSKK